MGKTLVLAVGPVLKRELLPAIDRAARELGIHHGGRRGHGGESLDSGFRRNDRNSSLTEPRTDLRELCGEERARDMAARNTAQAAEITFESLLFMDCIDTHEVARLIRESATGKNLARVFDWPEVLIGDAGIFWPTQSAEL